MTPIVTKDSNDLLAFFNGFGWEPRLMLANNVKQKEVVGVRILVVRPGPNPWYPWDPGIQGTRAPDCEWGCDDERRRRWRHYHNSQSNRPFSFWKWWRKESLQYLEQNSVQLANDLASLVATINLELRSRKSSLTI